MAREGYLVNAGEDTIHDPEAEKKAEEEKKSPKGKWQNFWFYHKTHVIIAAVILLFAGYLIWEQMQTVQPDYTIGMITQTLYPDEVTESLTEVFEKYGEDLNGDGKVKVLISQYPITAKTAPSAAASGTKSSSALRNNMQDPQMAQAYQQKYTAELASGTCMIYLTDDASFQAQLNAKTGIFAYTDGSTPKDGATDYDKMRVMLSKCPKLANLQVNYKTVDGKQITVPLSSLYKGAGISLRVYKGTSAEGKQEAYYKASKKLFQKLTG